MNGGIQGLHHGSINVVDWEASVSFYRDVLGLALLGTGEASGELMETALSRPGVRLRWAMFAVGDRHLELIQYVEPPAGRVTGETWDAGATHLAFKVRDVDEAYRDLSARGLSVLFYPFMKRVIWIPQIVLGLCFAWGALMGWAVAMGSLAAAPVLLYAGSIAWVVGYDTIYAVQDLEDDEIAGIKSSARFFGEHVRTGIAVCYTLACLLIGAALILVDSGPLAFLGLLAFAVHLGWQVMSVHAGDPAGALRLFRSNREAGLLLFAGLVLDAFLR